MTTTTNETARIIYRYTIRTDAALYEVAAADMDHAAKSFADAEFPGENITTVDDLFAKIRGIGDGAWCWIESDDAPDGLRRGGTRTDRCY